MIAGRATVVYQYIRIQSRSQIEHRNYRSLGGQGIETTILAQVRRDQSRMHACSQNTGVCIPSRKHSSLGNITSRGWSGSLDFLHGGNGLGFIANCYPNDSTFSVNEFGKCEADSRSTTSNEDGLLRLLLR